MSMLLATVNPGAAAAIGNIQKVGVGNTVVYHARAGYMRDRRTSFPALVLRQNEDGSLDLLVFMEREDFATEERVAFQSHNQPHHCWCAVEDVPGNADTDATGLFGIIREQMKMVFGPTDEPGVPSMADEIASMKARIAALENRPKPGRPPKAKAA